MAAQLRVIFLLLILAKSAHSFKIISATQNDVNFEPGQTLSLTCKSDYHWEFCLWKHSKPESETRECLMEWKRAKGGVALQKCHENLSDRVSVTGNYEKNECGLQITGLVEEDGGNWECEMEEYNLGDWTSGSKHSENFTISVRNRSSTVLPILITTTYRTSTVEQTTEVDDIESTTIVEIEENFTTDSNEIIKETENYNGDGTINEEPDTTVLNENLIALAVEDEKSEKTSAGPIVGIAVAVITLLVAVAVVGILWNKKHKFQLLDEENGWTNANAEVIMVDLVTKENMLDQMTREK